MSVVVLPIDHGLSGLATCCGSRRAGQDNRTFEPPTVGNDLGAVLAEFRSTATANLWFL